jgi:hypothetical protein
MQTQGSGSDKRSMGDFSLLPCLYVGSSPAGRMSADEDGALVYRKSTDGTFL